jgi:aspartyl aminopeptidase
MGVCVLCDTAWAVTTAIAPELLKFLQASPTPYHAVARGLEQLLAAGFRVLREEDPWEALPAGAYALPSEGSLFAFVVPDGAVQRISLVGAHTDSPNLRLKPKAEYTKEGYLQLGVEVYGGALLNSWLDRDLSLAGRVFVEEAGALVPKLVQIDRPLARVAQLAIHLDREQADRLTLNRQEHMAPIVGLDKDLTVRGLCERELGLAAGSIRATELMLFDTLAPTLGGPANEFIWSARLDNLAMCHAGLSALLRAKPQAQKGDALPFVALFDHEEVGSESAHGAHSGRLPRVLARVAKARGLSDDAYAQVLARSMCISADMAHAVHPNYDGKHEPRHKPVLNGGPVIKVNAQQRYATSARTAAFFAELCQQAKVPVQHYAHRTDLPCGTTIGPIASSLLGMATVDVGNPMLSMHSAREMGGAHDHEMMVTAMTLFLDGTVHP